MEDRRKSATLKIINFPKMLSTLMDPDESPFKLLTEKQKEELNALSQFIVNPRGQRMINTRADIRANIQKEWPW